MNSSPVHRCLMCFIAFLFMFTVSSFFAIAQQATPIAEPGAVLNVPTIEPAIQATADALEAAWIADYESRSIFDLRVAYLIGFDAMPEESVMSETSFAETLGAVVVHTWDDLIVENDREAFQIVLVHDSAYDQLDTEWTQYAYRNQVILVGIGMPFEHHVEMTGDRCLKEPNPHLADEAEDWVLLFAYSAQYKDESQRVPLDPSAFTSCRGRPPVVGETYDGVMHGSLNYPLTEPEHVDGFANALVLKAMYYGFE
jgi:hypothetical protein